MNTNYRSTLEYEKARIQRMQESPEGSKAQHLRNRLGFIVGELAAMDQGEHWTQLPGDTLARIVVADLAGNTRTIKTAS